jgi:hypothetical protein
VLTLSESFDDQREGEEAEEEQVRKRLKFLSITHKLHSDHDAQFYVGES